MMPWKQFLWSIEIYLQTYLAKKWNYLAKSSDGFFNLKPDIFSFDTMRTFNIFPLLLWNHIFKSLYHGKSWSQAYKN